MINGFGNGYNFFPFCLSKILMDYAELYSIVSKMELKEKIVEKYF